MAALPLYQMSRYSAAAALCGAKRAFQLAPRARRFAIEEAYI